MFSKGFIFAVLLTIGFVLVANVSCAPENVDPESLPIRVRRQLPGLPSIPQIPGVPDPSTFTKAGTNLAKGIPGADTITSNIPRGSRSIPDAPEMDSLMARVKREARGTGNLPTKTG